VVVTPDLFSLLSHDTTKRPPRLLQELSLTITDGSAYPHVLIVLELLVQLCRAFNCRILYDHYLPTVILIIMGIPSPTHSFTLGLNPYFSAIPPYRSLSFFFFRFHYMDFPDCLLLLLSISVSLLFGFFLFLHFF